MRKVINLKKMKKVKVVFLCWSHQSLQVFIHSKQDLKGDSSCCRKSKKKQLLYFPPSTLTLCSLSPAFYTLPHPNTQIWWGGCACELPGLFVVHTKLFYHYAWHLKRNIRTNTIQGAWECKQDKFKYNVTHIRHLNIKFFLFRHFGLCHTSY